MREVDLSKYNVRTDLVIDLVENQNIDKISYYNGIKISNLDLNKKDAKKLGKKPGFYTTIYFNDITDSTNYESVLTVLIKQLKKVFKESKIEKEASCMIIGLGNENSTADELGVKTAKKVVVTKHINDLVGNLEKGFRISTCFTPGVMGDTGIETSDVIESIIKVVKPDFIIVIDALASSNINNLLKTIQITNTGINPGSGVGNKRKELSMKVYNIPVIVIGVPTVVEASTIVSETLLSLQKYFKTNIKDKDFINVINELSEIDKKALIEEIIGYNLIVTPKDIDFIIAKLSNLIAEAINKTIHNISTKNT